MASPTRHRKPSDWSRHDPAGRAGESEANIVVDRFGIPWNINCEQAA